MHFADFPNGICFAPNCKVLFVNCYFRALQLGEASKVAPVDKLSVVVAMVLAALFLGEHLTWRHGIGAGLFVAGTVIIAKI
jgi:transporter family protein